MEGIRPPPPQGMRGRTLQSRQHRRRGIGSGNGNYSSHDRGISSRAGRQSLGTTPASHLHTVRVSLHRCCLLARKKQAPLTGDGTGGKPATPQAGSTCVIASPSRPVRATTGRSPYHGKRPTARTLSKEGRTAGRYPVLRRLAAMTQAVPVSVSHTRFDCDNQNNVGPDST